MIKMHCYDRSCVPVLWRKCLSCRRDCHTVIISYKWALPSCLPPRQVANEPEMFCWRLTELEFWYDLIVNENQMVKYETCCLTLLMTMAQWSHIFWFNPCIDILSMLTLFILYFYWVSMRDSHHNNCYRHHWIINQNQILKHSQNIFL